MDGISDGTVILVVVGLLNDYINVQTYRTVWTKLSTSDPKPGMRGGHQMLLDASAELLYLFGGWDGNQDLSDLWSYNIASSKWTVICKDTESVVSRRRRMGIVGRGIETDCLIVGWPECKVLSQNVPRSRTSATVYPRQIPGHAV